MPSCQLQKVRMAPQGAEKNPGFGIRFCCQGPLAGEKKTGGGLLGNRAKVPFGKLILEKEDTHSLRVNEKRHKVKMKFIMFLIFFLIFVFLNKTVCKTAILSPWQSDP